jgi:hypothetical protein
MLGACVVLVVTNLISQRLRCKQFSQRNLGQIKIHNLRHHCDDSLSFFDRFNRYKHQSLLFEF